MSATLINLIIQLIAGALGGNGAGNALKDPNLGPMGNTIAGAIGGVAGGQLLSARFRHSRVLLVRLMSAPYSAKRWAVVFPVQFSQPSLGSLRARWPPKRERAGGANNRDISLQLAYYQAKLRNRSSDWEAGMAGTQVSAPLDAARSPPHGGYGYGCGSVCGAGGTRGRCDRTSRFDDARLAHNHRAALVRPAAA